MKYAALFISLFGWGLCFGQSVRFELYRSGPCTTVEYLDTAYALYKAPYSIDTDFFPKKGIVYLPHVGKYRIYFVNGLLPDTTIDIRDTGFFVFHYTEPDIALYSGGLDMPPVYKSCGKLIKGYFEAFYPNGKIKIRGDFDEGYPRDSLVSYYANGTMKSKEQVLNKETIFETFDSLAHPVKITCRQNGSIISYRWQKSIEYFPNGVIKLKESNVNRIHKIREYYPDGGIKIRQTRGRRVEYLQGGSKKVVFRWRKKLELFEFHEKGSHDFTLHEKEYDEHGKILQTAVYKVWHNSWSPPTLQVEKADWIISLKKFMDGKMASNFSDDGTKVSKK